MNATDYMMQLTAVLEERYHDRFDFHFENGVLTIEDDDGGERILNAHAPTGQIWYASLTSGARHFAFHAEQNTWQDTKDQKELMVVLEEDLGCQ